MNILITLILILGFSFILNYLGKKIKIPSVVSFIVAGLVLGIPFLREHIIGSNSSYISVLGNIGLFILMLLAGMETSWNMLKQQEKNSAYIAIFGFIIPFVLGFAVFKLLGFSTLVSAIIGLCMSITAEATKARVLLDIKKLKTKLGSAMMGAGIIDDILGLSVFFIIALVNRLNYNEIILTLGVLASFFVGIIVQAKIREKRILKRVKKIFLLFVPLFFVSMGLHFDFNSLILNPMLLIIIIILAIAGKMAGVFLTKPFTHFNSKQLYVMGWAMNSRGAIEIGLALLAFKIGILNSELYSSLIIMTLVTTLIFPFIITRIVRKNPGVMD